MSVSNHLTTREGVYQYVRRVPEDLQAAFPFKRVQRSLRTRDAKQARAAAIDIDRLWDQKFNEARQQRGLLVDADRPAALATHEWSWPDWDALAAWFGATLAEEDWRARLGSVKGIALSSEPDLRQLPWRDNETAKEHVARQRRLEGSDVSTYASDRFHFVQRYVRQVGVALSRAEPNYQRFMAACLRAELDYLHLFQLRESRRGGMDHIHPDRVDGPWRMAKVSSTAHQHAVSHLAPQPEHTVTRVGKSLMDCRAKWVENRVKTKKQVRDDYLRDMEQTIRSFEDHASVKDLGDIRRRHVLAFRDHLGSTSGYKVATINKKVGFITTLHTVALKAGWVEQSIGENVFLEVPEDEGAREPYRNDDLLNIFSHRIFTSGYRFSRTKACGELQFWLPLIACLHGMISSEILQLGPDTVKPHPDAPSILCFEVTNAGDRRVKTLARRRWVPVRDELRSLGLDALIDSARAQQRQWLWSDMHKTGGDITRVSGYFSSFWATLSQGELAVANGLSLYSFRHSFQDALSRNGSSDEIKKALMGHSDSGMTSRYGTKRRPREVNIEDLNAAIQSLDWSFLRKIQGTS